MKELDGSPKRTTGPTCGYFFSFACAFRFLRRGGKGIDARVPGRRRGATKSSSPTTAEQPLSPLQPVSPLRSWTPERDPPRSKDRPAMGLRICRSRVRQPSAPRTNVDSLQRTSSPPLDVPPVTRSTLSSQPLSARSRR